MKIKDFSDLRTGHAFRERLVGQPDGNVSVIQPKDIKADGNVAFSDGKPLRTNISSPRTLNQKDVLVLNRGRFAAVVFDLPGEVNWIVPSSIMILSIREESVLPEYIALYLNSPEGQRIFQRHFEYSTIPFISTNNMASIEIPIPPLDRQRALVKYQEAVREYKLLTKRKHELYNQILSHELRGNEIIIQGREQ